MEIELSFLEASNRWSNSAPATVSMLRPLLGNCRPPECKFTLTARLFRICNFAYTNRACVIVIVAA